jgi:hypothetical protein
MILSLVVNYLQKEEISVEFHQKLGVMTYKATAVVTALDNEQGSRTDGGENKDKDKSFFE